MDGLNENEFTGKTVDEAIAEGLKTLGIEKEQAEITILEEGKKKLFGSVKARVLVVKKATDGERALAFIDGLLDILKIPSTSEIVADGEKIEIEITTTNTSAVIGRRGEVLDAIQCIAGAVANIGREEYRRVVVDCENYRAVREEKIKNLAIAKAKKAVETEHRVALDPMSPYERRIVHSILAENEEVKTISEGKEPMRRVIIIPNNEKPYEKRPYRKPYDRNRRPAPQGGRQFNRDRRYGDRGNDGYKKPEDGEQGEKPEGGYPRDRRYGDRGNGGYRGRQNGDYNRNRQDGNGGYNRDRNRRNGNGNGGNRSSRGKKEIHFGTYLGNSGNTGNTDNGGNSGDNNGNKEE